MPIINDVSIIYPVFALVLLTFIVWLKMYYVRFSTMKKQGITASEMNASNRNLPKEIIFSGDNFRNLCQMPILFYAGIIFIVVLGVSDIVFLTLAWLFVALRIVHSFIHTTYNKISHRFLAYFFSSLVLWVLWFKLAYQLANI